MHLRIRKTETTAFFIAAALFFSGCRSSATGSSGNPSGSGGAATASTSPSTTGTSVKPQALAAIAFESDGIVMAPGSSRKLNVTALLKNNGKQDISGTQGLAYSSSLPGDITVDEKGTIHISSTAKTGTSAKITAAYEGQSKVCTVTVKYSLEDTVKAVNGKTTVTNAADIAVVVNKKRALPADYIPSDLVYPNVPFSFNENIEKRMLRSEAAKALEQLITGADKDKIKLAGVSGYRSYKTQVSVFSGYVKTQGEVEARKYSAEPGQSEHQTGLAIDVSSQSAKFALDASFAATVESKWLAQHCAEYGFIIRYLKGKESITGYEYEPWHIRYVGVDMAKEIMDKGITLEEYFQDAIAVSR